MTLTRLYFVASLALSAAGFVACREAARGSAWWAVAQWGFAALALANVGILYVVRGDGDDSDDGAS